MYRRYREISSLDLSDLDSIKPMVTFYRVVPAIIRLGFIYYALTIPAAALCTEDIEISCLDLPDLDSIKPMVTFYRVVPAIIRLGFIYYTLTIPAAALCTGDIERSAALISQTWTASNQWSHSTELSQQ